MKGKVCFIALEDKMIGVRKTNLISWFDVIKTGSLKLYSCEEKSYKHEEKTFMTSGCCA